MSGSKPHKAETIGFLRPSTMMLRWVEVSVPLFYITLTPQSPNFRNLFTTTLLQGLPPLLLLERQLKKGPRGWPFGTEEMWRIWFRRRVSAIFFFLMEG
jgi:hypothetical protein